MSIVSIWKSIFSDSDYDFRYDKFYQYKNIILQYKNIIL